LAISLVGSVFIPDDSLLIFSGIRNHVLWLDAGSYRNHFCITIQPNQKVKIIDFVRSISHSEDQELIKSKNLYSSFAAFDLRSYIESLDLQIDIFSHKSRLVRGKSAFY